MCSDNKIIEREKENYKHRTYDSSCFWWGKVHVRFVLELILHAIYRQHSSFGVGC